MSKALAKVALLKPEIRLGQAVSEFEADLSVEQKVEFRALRLQSSKAAPDQNDVMRLTAKMDKFISNKFGGQCFGPRFTNFIQGVQQFAALGDIIIGGSQNLVACGVWSVVRMSLLSFVNLSAYVDKLSSLFMAIGRTIPRYQGMALLYPHSKALQSSLAEYFILVVELCHHIFKFGQRSCVRQFTSSLSDTHLKTFQTDLDKWANSIKEEICLAEAQENYKSRLLTREIFKSHSHQQSYASKIQVLDFCSKYDHETTWKQTRKVGNSSFYKNSTEYQEWKDCSHSSTLVYTGKLGSGKSVLLANIVDDLTLYTENDRTIVAYFFCKHDIRESLEARTILGSIIRQLLCTVPDIGVLAKRYENTYVRGSNEDLMRLVKEAFPKERKAYVVLDGIDECDLDQRETLAKALQEIQGLLQMLVCISFREEPDNGLHAITKELITTHIVCLPESNPDIEAFIETELERCLQKGLLTIGDPTLIFEIQDALLKGSQGMFLWVALQIRTLCDKKTDHAIREALADLPKDLSGTFARILHKSGTDPLLQTRTLQLVLAATRPLTTDELREALSVVPGDAVWDPSKLLHDAYSALACCGCLLVVDEEEFTVRVVHHSVKQYLLAGHDGTGRTRFSLKDAQRTLADVMVTYLCYGVFETQLSKIKANPVMAQSLPSKIVQATMSSSRNRRSLAIKFLKSRKQPTFDMSKAVAEMNISSQSKKDNTFSFYQYANTHWEELILYASGKDAAISRLASKLINSKGPKLKFAQGELWKVSQQAVENGNEKILEPLLQHWKVDYLAESRELSWWLLVAISKGYADLVETLLSLGDYSGTGALILAASEGHIRVVKVLLDQVMLYYGKADVNETDSHGNTSLIAAASNGHKDVVELILATGKADVNARNNMGQRALMVAASNGHRDVVDVILATGKADVNTRDNMGQTALIAAAWHRYEDVIELLLKDGNAGINVNGPMGRTLLMEAASNGNPLLVEMILKSGKFDVNERDDIGQTALMYAVDKGYPNVARVLLEIGGADINAVDNGGLTALETAVRGGLDTVDLLRSYGALDSQEIRARLV